MFNVCRMTTKKICSKNEYAQNKQYPLEESQFKNRKKSMVGSLIFHCCPSELNIRKMQSTLYNLPNISYLCDFVFFFYCYKSF